MTQLRYSIRYALAVTVLLACAGPFALAQSMFATLTGTVTDGAGAMVPGVSVVVKNSASGETRSTITNHEGYFSVTTLPAGAYQVLVNAKGFAKYSAHGIVLTGGDARSMNIDLKVGNTEEVVEVQANVTELAPVESGEKAYTLSASDLNQLSLVGRDATEIVDLIPGAVMVANSGVNSKQSSAQGTMMNAPSALGNSTVNGQAVDVTMDGGHTFDPGAAGSQTPVVSNQDMISEVKILTSNFTAENAKGPVVVNANTKSGGDQFHGDVYFYASNSTLNSIDAMEREEGIKTPAPEHYYNAGATIGGPVIVPGTRFNKLRNKLFFFDGFEKYLQDKDIGLDTAFVPTTAMLSGDFSAVHSYPFVVGGNVLNATPTQPANTWLAFQPLQSVSQPRLAGCAINAAGVLNSACLDPNALALFKAYSPAPTTPNGIPNAQGENFVQRLDQPSNMYQNMVRIDYDFSDNTKLYVTYNRERQNVNWTQGLWQYTAGGSDAIPEPGGAVGFDQDDNVGATLMHVFSSTLTSETKVFYTYLNYPTNATDSSLTSRQNVEKATGFDIQGVYKGNASPNLVTWTAGFPNMGPVGWQFPVTCYKKMPAIGEDITKVLGRHTAKAGLYAESVENVGDGWGYWGGAFDYGNYWPTPSGNQYADAFMGIGQGMYTEQPSPGAINEKQVVVSWYVQDDWKFTRRLTFQYGLRFDHYGKPYSKPYGLAVFNPATYDNDPSAITENTGVTWHGVDSHVPYSGAPSRLFFYSPRIGGAFDLFGKGRTILRGGWGKYRAYDNITGGNYTAPAATAMGSVQWTCQSNDPQCPSWEDVDSHQQTFKFGQGLPASTWPAAITTMDPKNDEIPLVSTFSASIDQRLPWRLSSEVSYVGNISKYLQNQVNINAIPAGALLGTACSMTLSVQCLQTYRPYQNYQGIESTMSAGKARFDSLQLSVQRNTQNLTLMLNYTFSKALGDGLIGGDAGSAYADYGAKEFYGVLPNDRPNVLSTIYAWHVPSLHTNNALLKGVANGWLISGTTQIESGANLTANGHGLNFGYNPGPMSAQDSPSGQSVAFNNATMLGTTSIQLQPLLTCNPRKGNAKGFYLNASCFSLPAGNGVNGTTKMPYLPGPMYWNSDLTLAKNFKVGEHKSAELRMAGFNFLNHPLLSFQQGDAHLDMNNMAYVAGRGEVNTDSDFGHAMWHSGQRKVELAAKFYF